MTGNFLLDWYVVVWAQMRDLLVTGSACRTQEVMGHHGTLAMVQLEAFLGVRYGCCLWIHLVDSTQLVRLLWDCL